MVGWMDIISSYWINKRTIYDIFVICHCWRTLADPLGGRIFKTRQVLRNACVVAESAVSGIEKLLFISFHCQD